MALKDWEKIESRSSLPRWEHKEKNLVIFLSYTPIEKNHWQVTLEKIGYFHEVIFESFEISRAEAMKTITSLRRKY